MGAENGLVGWLEMRGKRRAKRGRRCFMLTACRANCHRTELIVVLVVVVLAQKVKDEHENGLVRGFSGVRRKQ